jgi:uncharacterized SAM-binding protein YcdF (DUF218 family)
MDTFVALKVLSQLVLPPGSLAVALLLCLVLVPLGGQRLARLLVVLALVETVVMSFPPVGDALMTYLEDQARTAGQQAPPCCYEAIVVLGGGVAAALPPARPFPDLSDAADRVWLAARLYRERVAPRVIVSGGSFMARPGEPETTEAAAMRRFLIDLGVPADAIVSEGTSINTIENIRNVRALVGDKRVALVTSGYHMPRALRLAARARLSVGAFPTDFRAVRAARPVWENWLPSLDGLDMASRALRELIAIPFDFRSAALEQ